MTTHAFQFQQPQLPGRHRHGNRLLSKNARRHRLRNQRTYDRTVAFLKRTGEFVRGIISGPSYREQLFPAIRISP